MPLPRRSAEHRLAHVGQRRAAAELDAERARQLGVADRRATSPAARARSVTPSTTPAVGVALEARSSGRRSRSPRARGRRRRRCGGRARARRRSSRRPPGRRRRRSGSASRRPSRGCRTGTRRRRARRRRRRATSASHGSPAGLDGRPRPSVGALDAARARRARRCRRSRVGDDDVAAAGEHQQRLARGVGRRARPRRARPRSSASTSRAAGPPRRSVVSSRSGRTCARTLAVRAATSCAQHPAGQPPVDPSPRRAGLTEYASRGRSRQGPSAGRRTLPAMALFARRRTRWSLASPCCSRC